MSFGQFLAYFVISEIVVQCLILGLLLLRRSMDQRKLAALIKDKKVRLITEDELLDIADEDKSNWN